MTTCSGLTIVWIEKSTFDTVIFLFGTNRIFVATINVRFNVPGDPGDRVIPGQRDSVLAFDYMEGHMERNEATFQLNFVTNEGHNVARLQYWDIEPPIEEVLGNASCIGLFRVLYFWRGTQPINSLSFAMLRE